jgi:hypothetical protein
VSGWLFLAIATVICAGVFLNGVRFARMEANPWAGRRLFGLPVAGSRYSAERVRFTGKLNMILAPVIWLFIAAMCFGLLGPINGIHLIKF